RLFVSWRSCDQCPGRMGTLDRCEAEIQRGGLAAAPCLVTGYCPGVIVTGLFTMSTFSAWILPFMNRAGASEPQIRTTCDAKSSCARPLSVTRIELPTTTGVESIRSL